MQDPIQRKWLMQPGGIVERLRQLQGPTRGTEFAERSGMRPSKVSKLRLGQQTPTEDDIRAWVAAAGGSPAELDELLTILAAADRHTTSFERALKRGQAAHQETYNELVKQAKRVRMLERSFVPAFLQTRDYAIAIITGSKDLHNAADDVVEAVDTRLERQRYLYEGDRTFEFVIDETVLTRTIGSAQIMHEQVKKVLDATDLRRVKIGILPVYGVFHDPVRNSFELYGDVAVAETYADDDPLNEEKAAKYRRVMDGIWQDAVTGDAARTLIRAAMLRHADVARQEREQEAR